MGLWLECCLRTCDPSPSLSFLLEEVSRENPACDLTLIGASAGRTNGGAALTAVDRREIITRLRIARVVDDHSLGDSVNAILPTIIAFLCVSDMIKSYFALSVVI